MSVPDQAAVAVLSQVALAADGAVLGLALAYIAVRSVLKFKTTSSALNKVKKAPSVSVSDLRSVLSNPSDQGTDTTTFSDEKIVIVRGVVETKSVVNGNWKKQNVLVSHESNEKAVILQTTQTCIYNEWRGLFGWTSDLRSLFARSWKEQESSSIRTVPFILVDGGKWPQSDYLTVNLDGSKHPLPLTTVYHNLQPIHASPYTILQACFGHAYPVGLLDEEKILPVGKEITAVGLISLKNGIPEVMACKDLPFFLSNMSKDQMVVELAFRTKVLLWSGIVIGSVSIGILGYAVIRPTDPIRTPQLKNVRARAVGDRLGSCRTGLAKAANNILVYVRLDVTKFSNSTVIRNWRRWKGWKERRQIEQQNAAEEMNEAEGRVAGEEDGDIPEGQLCVICLMRQRRSAFVPCGHLVCCPRCALSVERDLSPKCPVCRQTIRSSVRIYDS